ncbi:formyltetrahydrofolate hydrolase [Actinopolyspora biskrensis]|uniref:Formyltetrahydrofolate hydrolase n=1 Tax=Actinopolyspora biskrensis TaxID=1470178 RepID=A0A852YUB2_9ACTN|nr:hypothetical protein [Actinopolyspora biskrensis]NYH77558.1 formyltetrahydrofolate hydrolase [Actinopolyspora biskrensis]
MTASRQASSTAESASAHQHASLVVRGRDSPGTVAATAGVLREHHASIVPLDQCSDNPQGGAFFQRTVFGLDNLKAALPGIESAPEERPAREFDLEFTVREMPVPERVAVFASKADHLRLLRGNVALVVLARHMRIPSEEFPSELGVPIIKILHSFLPAFIGAVPTRRPSSAGSSTSVPRRTT